MITQYFLLKLTRKIILFTRKKNNYLHVLNAITEKWLIYYLITHSSVVCYNCLVHHDFMTPKHRYTSVSFYGLPILHSLIRGIMPTNSKCHEKNKNKFSKWNKEIMPKPTILVIINWIKWNHKCWYSIKLLVIS